MSENQYAPGTYAKGDDVRVANSPSEAVALVFDGFKLVEAASEQPVADEPQADESPTPTPTPSPRELARPKKSQEDTQS